MILELWHGDKYDCETETMIMADGKEHHAPMVSDDTPEWKAMLEWADEYMKVLEGSSQK